MLSEIILDRRKISNVVNIKGDKCPGCVLAPAPTTLRGGAGGRKLHLREGGGGGRDELGNTAAKDIHQAPSWS